MHKQHNFLITGSWDRIVRAVDLKNGEIDRSFVASRQAIKCLHLYDKWLFVGGMDPIVYAYDLTSGDVKSYEGHQSWVLSITTHVILKEDGSIKSQWLLTGSDDTTVRIWDIVSTKCMEKLIGHTDGVTCIAFANN